MSRPHSRAVVLLLLLITPGRAYGQESSAARELLDDLKEGDRVRVLAPPDSLVEGEFARFDGEGLALRFDRAAGVGLPDVPQTAAVESIEALWTRSRRTWLGAGIGAGVGGLIGGLYGAAIASVSDSDPDPAGLALVVGLVGAGAGALLGALVGSAFSHWSLEFEQEADGRGWNVPLRAEAAAEPIVAEAPAPGPEPAAGAPRRDPLAGRTGWLNLQLGGSLSSGEGTTKAGILLGGSIVADFGVLRVGPEVLFAGIGSSQEVVTYGGVIHVPLGHGSREPYLLFGAGGQAWSSTAADYDLVDAELFALNGGAGIRFPIGSRLAGGVELRAHRSVQEYGGPVPWLFTLGANLGVGL